MYGMLIHSSSATWTPLTPSFVSASASEQAAVSRPATAIARSTSRLGGFAHDHWYCVWRSHAGSVLTPRFPYMDGTSHGRPLPVGRDG